MRKDAQFDDGWALLLQVPLQLLVVRVTCRRAKCSEVEPMANTEHRRRHFGFISEPGSR